MSTPHDLNVLANNAAKAIEHAETQRASRQPRRAGSSPGLKTWTAVALAGLLIYSASDTHSQRFWFGVSEQKQIAEMTATLTAARLAVDSAHTTTGEWPKQVPLPALAALVELQSPGPDYRLLTRTSNTQLTMTPSGDLQKSVQ